jgi:hypothetical protein
VACADSQLASAGSTTSTRAATVEKHLSDLGSRSPAIGSGEAIHGATVNVPFGSVADWAIFVSSRIAGEEEGPNEDNNALLVSECYAMAASETSWTITARYKYRFSQELDPEWRTGVANYLLLPKQA